MPSASALTRDLGSYNPAIDFRRRDNPCVIRGQNFLHEIDGPRAAFASAFANYFGLGEDTRIKVASFYVGMDYIYATNTGLWKIDSVSKSPVLLYQVTVTETYWPWSYAQVGGLHYFAQYNIGLIQYDPDTETFTLVDTPEDVKFICESVGRLVVLGPNLVFWSSLDDGTDFVASTTTGAGAQSLALLSKTAFRVDPVDDGVLVSTDKGTMKGTFAQANFVFHWDVLSRKVKIFSPNAAVISPDLGLILLDHSGLYTTQGQAPELFEEPMSTYLRDTFLSTMDKSLYGLVQLSYADDGDKLYVSIADNALEGLFRLAFVYSVRSKAWGVMRRAHTSIIDLNISTFSQKISGFVDTNGYMRYFTREGYIETIPDDPYVLDDVVRRAASEPTSRTEVDVLGNAVHIGQTDINTAVEDVSPYADLLTGTYILNADEEVQRFSLGQLALDAFIDIGPYRFVEQKAANETSMLSSIVIGTKAVPQGITINEDWLTINADDEDWLSFADGFDEDWGEDLDPADEFDLDLYSTMDGVNTQIEGAERLQVLEEFGAGFQYAPCGISGVFHHLRLSATSAGQSFSPKYVELEGVLTGQVW